MLQFTGYVISWIRYVTNDIPLSFKLIFMASSIIKSKIIKNN